MIRSTSHRKFALTVHVTCSVSWIGSVLTYLTLGLTAVTSQETQTIRAAWIAMAQLGWYTIVPLAIASLLTGLIMSLGTKWGLLRHYWTLISFLLTSFATTILLWHMRDVSVMATIAQQAEGDQLAALGGDLFHPGLGLIVLLLIQVLNMYKPRGLTRYGWRKQYQQHTSTHL